MIRLACAALVAATVFASPASAAKSSWHAVVSLAGYADPSNRLSAFPAWARVAFKSDSDGGNSGDSCQ